jgi:predicted metalloprotease with PDZ domain
MVPMMKIARVAAGLCAALLLAAVVPHVAQSQSTPGIETVEVDTTDVARGIVHARLTIPVSGTDVTLDYPAWLPGEHAPDGPIADLADLHVAGGGHDLAWRRDLVDLYAFHVTVPAGVTSIDVSLDYLLAAGGGGPYVSKERISTSKLYMLGWYALVLYPRGAVNSVLQVAPSITLAPGWDFGTALDTAARDGQHVTFKQTSFERLLDSPLLTGVNFKRYILDNGARPAEIDVAADVPEDREIPEARVRQLRNLIHQADAEYGARHWNHYNFLLSVTDLIGFNGIEHHESSDNRVTAGVMRDSDLFDAQADLLPHEFTHSWNGKYRRPFDLQVTNYNDPERTDLLWVYEGLTEYLGNVLATRSGLADAARFREAIADKAAALDTTPGRLWRPLADTTTSAPFLYAATSQFARIRRSVDFYAEGVLLWLDADGIIRQRSDGRKSLDDFVRAFYGPPSTGPKVVTYTREDIIRALNAVQPYDWTSFIHDRIDVVTADPPFGGLISHGWQLAYGATPTTYQKSAENGNKQLNALYSLGLLVNTDTGDIIDTEPASPAADAGLAPYGRILAIGGRRFSPAAFHAVVAATAGHPDAVVPIVVDQLGTVFTAELHYGGGERYPFLERIPHADDRLASVLAPRN